MGLAVRSMTVLLVCRGLWDGEGVLGFKIRDVTMIVTSFVYFVFLLSHSNSKAQEFSVVGVIRVKFFLGETLVNDFSRAMLQKQCWTTRQSKLL